MIKNISRLLCVFGMCSWLDGVLATENQSLAKDDVISIHSGEIEYDGKKIILVGEVVVQHSLGQIAARRVSIQPVIDKDHRKNKFGLLTMSENVVLNLPEGGELQCQESEVDYGKMQGIFFGNEAFPDVVYFNKGEKKKNSSELKPPIELKSHKMIIDLIRDPKTSKTLVKQILAQNNIRVSYDHNYFLLADEAIYQWQISVENGSNNGVLTLSGNHDHSFCQLNTLNGDKLLAENIQVNTNNQTLLLKKPSGKLFLNQQKRPSEVLEFTANELLWNNQQQTLQLIGDVNLTENGNMSVQTDAELCIKQDEVNGKRVLHSIQAPKNVQVSYSESAKEMTHKIVCPGAFLIDHEHQQMSFQKAILGKGEDQGQVYIESILGEMYADLIKIDYRWLEKQFIPEKIVLMGNVRLLNRFDGHLEESSSILHYALADDIEYFPQTQEMSLSSKSDNRVLFFDKVNNIQMSASSLKLKHDSKTKKNAIQGLGDVRFTFIEKEFEQIKQRFRLEPSKD